MLLALLALALAPAAGSPEGARAPPRDAVHIRWEGPGACARGQALRARLDALLRNASEPAQGSVDARVTPGATQDRFDLSLEVASTAGVWTRELDDARCDALVEAAALIAALNLDPMAVAEDLPQSRAPAPAPEPPVADPGRRIAPADEGFVPTPPPAAPRPRADDEVAPDPAPADRAASSRAGGGPRDRRSTRRRLGFATRAAAGARYGPTPRVGAYVIAGVGLTLDRRGLFEVAALHRFQDRSRVAEAPAALILTSQTGGRINGCWTPRTRSLEAPLCGGIELAALSAEAAGIPHAAPVRTLHAEVFADARLLWRPTAVIAAGLELSGGVALTRRAYTIAELALPVLTTIPASVSVGLSLEIRLP
ncbi:MAG: hypothetical protein R3A51_08460 [Nannocystaceae bacterium]